MSTTIATPINQIELSPGSAIQISGINWESYLALLQDLGDERPTRLSYTDGVLDVRMPGQQHEAINRVLAAIVMTLAEEFGFEFNNLGSTTLNRPEFSKGLEPDSCFYIQNAQAGQGLTDTSILSNLPPDLAIEIDVAHRSDSKFSIYKALAVPEVWLYQGDCLKIKSLDPDQYVEVSTSRAFPAISVDQLNQWLELRRTGTDLTVIRAVRQVCLLLKNAP
jgi:Uma2 family endonuclease